MGWYFQPYDQYTDFFTLDSWVEISSQPSSSSLSSINDEIVTTGLRVQHDPRQRRRRVVRPGAPSTLNISTGPSSIGGTSSQEEYEESESESDHIMTSSGEGPHPGARVCHADGTSPALFPSTRDGAAQESSDDENRTAINYPINNDACFTPQPNAFSHPPSSGHVRTASQPVPGSYFPTQRPSSRPTTRHSLPTQHDQSRQHMPQNILSPSYNAALQHDEALRASLSTLLSCAAAARGLKGETKRPQIHPATQPRGNRIELMSFRLLPESALPVASSPPTHNAMQEPTFKPTLRRTSTSTTSTSASPAHMTLPHFKEPKRKSRPHSKDRGRNSVKKVRRSSSSEELNGISPTLLTWVVSAGVVVVLSALSFSAGYSIGKEAGRFEASTFGGAGVGNAGGDEVLRGCAREAGRTSMGLKRSLARSAVQV